MSTPKVSGNPLDTIRQQNAADTSPAENSKELSEKQFRIFESARPSVRLITDSGFRITFTGYKYVTQNAGAIAYLEQCIKDKVPGITDKGITTSDDLNPEKALKDKYFAEFLAEQEKAKAEGRDFGTTEGASKIKVASTADQPK